MGMNENVVIGIVTCPFWWLFGGRIARVCSPDWCVRILFTAVGSLNLHRAHGVPAPVTAVPSLSRGTRGLDEIYTTVNCLMVNDAKFG